MKPFVLKIAIGLLTVLALTGGAGAQSTNSMTDWLKEARYGVFIHFLPSGQEGLRQVEQFDTQRIADQLDEMGAGYLVLTLGQNSGYFNSPNATYNGRTGYAPGERCATRDLPLELFQALQSKHIRLLLYLPCQTPNQDARAQKAFGLALGAADQPIDLAFAEKWSAVIQEWADRYGDRVSGWWFDGGYAHIHFNEAIAARYAAAVKHGNPNALVTFNPGVQVVRWTKAEDYTAGELNDPFSVVPAGRWLEGSQWHALTYLGSQWGQRNTRFSDSQWADWARKVTASQGVLTLDMGPNYNASAGPIGSLAEAQVKQVQAIRAALRPHASAPWPKRLKRADSFFGIHFDFHAGSDCTEIGRNTTPAMIEKIIQQAHPDYIQIDCKGHPGLSSYPTKAGNQAPGFVGDPLHIWREVTARNGVALYMHYSGVWDSEAIRRHPEWGVINADGTTNSNATSLFGPYTDRLLIPQLRELADEYGVDGVWVDGDCWASVPDFSLPALQAFRETTGIETVPRRPGEPGWFEFLQFHRDAFRRRLRHCIAEVKLTHPEMQFCSNWAFSDHMPEAVCAPVDWISGDFSPEDAVNSARISARYLAHQGKPWDLMAWGFTTQGESRQGSRSKSAVQLEREAAVVLAQGGGFQSYYNQRRDGSVPEEFLPTIGEVAKFCRERQPFCQGAKPVAQIALVYSTASHYREINGLFSRDLSRLSGTLQALLESQQVVDVVSEHQLTGRMAEYPLIMVAECDYLDSDFKSSLMAYVKNGGNLLLVGPQVASLFPAELGVTFEAPQSERRYLACGTQFVPTQDLTRGVKLEAKAQPYGRLHLTPDPNSAAQPAATLTPLGEGKIAATYFCFSRGYLSGPSTEARAFLNGLVRELFRTPMVEVLGSPKVDLSIQRVAGKLAINLVNNSGPHRDLKKPLLDVIEPVGPFEMIVRTQTKPTRATMEPGAHPIDMSYQDGKAHLTVPSLEIYSIILVE